MRIRAAVATILAYACLMPPIGAIVFVWGEALLQLCRGAQVSLVGNMFVLALALPSSYIVAAIPAILSGVSVVSLAHQLPALMGGRTWRRAALCGFVGLLACGVYFGVFYYFLPEPNVSGLLRATWFLAQIGGISAALVGCVIPRAPWIRR